MVQNRVPHIPDGNLAPKGAVDIFIDDLGIATDSRRGLAFPAPLASMALQVFVTAAGMGRDGGASVARMIAGPAGLDLPGPTA
jgi:3-hydroxyisobutyrate dehydrogenase